MGKRQSLRATMITNFDSTEQSQEWNDLVKQYPAYPSIRNLWCRTDTYRPCERLLNDYTDIATHFAGIVRTAYMYCPKIMLTEAQLLDGLFFLALGPTAVNGVLGKSYKDGPAIIVSGRHPTLEDCLVAFTTKSIEDVKEDAQKAAEQENETILPEDLVCAGTEEQLTVRPLEYCVFGTTVTWNQALGLNSRFYTEFTNRLKHAHETGELKSTIIAEMYAQLLYGAEADGDASDWYGAAIEDRCRFLGQRWQEWIDAEKQGLVLYENQNDASVKELTKSKGFVPYFEANARDCAEVLRKQFHLRDLAGAANTGSSGGNDTTVTFAQTLQAIAKMPKRTDARMCIDRAVELPEGKPALRETETDEETVDESVDGSTGKWFGKSVGKVGKVEKPEMSRQLLRDWYQFVYQKTMAQHLGAYLVAVSAPNNSFARLAGDRSSRSSLVLNGSITKQLGKMPFVLFATFCYQSQPVIEAWRKCNADTSKRIQKINTRNVAYAVEQACQQKSLKGDGIDMLWSALVAGVLALLSALSDNVWFNGKSPIWLVVMVAMVHRHCAESYRYREMAAGCEVEF